MGVIADIQKDLEKVKDHRDKVRYLKKLFKKLKDPLARQQLQKIIETIKNKNVQEEPSPSEEKPKVVVSLPQEKKEPSLEDKVREAEPQTKQQEQGKYISRQLDQYSVTMSGHSRLEAIKEHLKRQHILGGLSQESLHMVRDEMRQYDPALSEYQLNQYMALLTQEKTKYESRFLPSTSVREIINKKQEEEKKKYLKKLT